MRTSSTIDRKINSLYVHIPFCEHICFYCDFVKVKKPQDPNVIEKYLDKLEFELNEYEDKLDEIQSIYIGGGTPSCLNEEQTTRMCSLLHRYSNKPNFEYSIELNPESVTREKLEIYKKFNINRISMGVQTFDNELLKKIGRIHDNSIAINAYKLIREVGFENVSIDLMYNLYDQTKQNIQTDLNYINELKPDHISWYSLIMKEKSVWGRKNMKVPENDELFDEIVNQGLKELGYIRYEISNYSLGEKNKSIHNMSYWNNSLFAGVGIGATGFEQIDGEYYLTKNEGNILNYKKEFEHLSKEDYYFQIVMMGLRLVDGIDISLDINKEIYDFYKQKIEEKIKDNLLEIVDNKIRCTERGFNILNEILIDFL
ncbi:radical SAM family heme chaperone HemW [Spiroplasma sp. BIUS-1]|uniref:radical SAM family heme chaperone HemW n=1 Tax=Spiroplasma sp. BIUS-1 TaxID=216964 RepID=UPI001397CA7F|nr:radical SAM family heme chaperone HemW [Spiroplasma sp. BIUS-1]QHX36538.1 oxygen-independent coproporphyrinogen III oxidase [Spiroplasma sp. BIUS-1]